MWIIKKPLAHRGLYDNIMGPPENSLAAFKDACDSGYGFECDVRLLADGELVVFHDADAKRLADRPGAIEALDSSSLTGLRLLWSEEHIPTLGEVLRLVNGKVPILIETKSMDASGVLEFKLWELLSDYPGEWGIVSFNANSVGWFSGFAPGVPRGLNLKPFADTAENRACFAGVMRRMLDVATPTFIGCDIRSLTDWAAAHIHELGLPIIGWTVTDEHLQVKALKLCDNYIFENLRP